VSLVDGCESLNAGSEELKLGIAFADFAESLEEIGDGLIMRIEQPTLG
jgi:hypothetical protein